MLGPEKPPAALSRAAVVSEPSPAYSRTEAAVVESQRRSPENRLAGHGQDLDRTTIGSGPRLRPDAFARGQRSKAASTRGTGRSADGSSRRFRRALATEAVGVPASHAVDFGIQEPDLAGDARSRHRRLEDLILHGPASGGKWEVGQGTAAADCRDCQRDSSGRALDGADHASKIDPQRR